MQDVPDQNTRMSSSLPSSLSCLPFFPLSPLVPQHLLILFRCTVVDVDERWENACGPSYLRPCSHPLASHSASLHVTCSPRSFALCVAFAFHGLLLHAFLMWPFLRRAFSIHMPSSCWWHSLFVSLSFK